MFIAVLEKAGIFIYRGDSELCITKDNLVGWCYYSEEIENLISQLSFHKYYLAENFFQHKEITKESFIAALTIVRNKKREGKSKK